MDYLDIQTIKKALDYTAGNYDNPTDYVARERANKFANKYGLNADDLDNYRKSAWMPPNQAAPIKSAVLDKIWTKEYALEGVGANSPVGLGERFAIKNLIDEDPDLQVKYLQRKGYNARFNTQTNELEAARPGEYFQRVDPAGLDPGDVIDVAGDALQAGIEGVVTGARALSGPIGFVATIPVGAAVAGGLETGKQAIANMAGLSDDYDLQRIALKSTLGGVLPILPKLAGAIPKATGEAYKFIPKSNTEAIVEAGQAMGAVPTRGMLNENIVAQEVEDALWRHRPPTGMNKGVIEQVQSNINATDRYAKDLLAGRSGGSKVDAGRLIQEGLSAKLNEKLGRSEALYDGIQKKLGLPGFVVDTGPLNRTLDVLEEGFRFDPIGRNWASGLRDEIANVRTIEDLRQFNRRLANDVQRYRLNDPSLSGAAQTLSNRSKTLVDETFNGIIDQKAINLDTMPADKAAEFTSYINGLRNDLREANRLYYEVNQQANAILRRPGSPIQEKGSAATKIQKIENQDFTKSFSNVYSAGDVKKAEYMKKNFPEEFKIAQSAKLEDIWQKATQSTKNSRQSLGSKISQQIRNLSDAEKEILFGKEGIKKANYLATWFAEKPIVISPSGTPQGLEIMRGIPNYAGQAFSAFRYALGSPSSKMRAAISAFGKTVDNPVTRGGLYHGSVKTFVPQNDVSDQYSFP